MIRPLLYAFHSVVTATLLAWPAMLLAADNDSSIPYIELSDTENSAIESATIDRSEKGWALKTASWMELQHDNLTEVVYTSASALDRYVARDSYDDMALNNTYMRLRLKQRFYEAGERSFETDVKLRVDLPHSKKRIKFFFDSNPDDFDDLDSRFRNIGTGSENIDDAESSAVAGLRFEPGKDWKWQPNLGVGLKLKLPLNPYVRFKLRRLDDWGDHWSSYFRQTFYYYHVDSWGSDTELDFYRPFAENFLFRSVSAAKYLHKDDLWELLQSFSIYQSINARNAFEYQVGMTADDDPWLRSKNYWLRSEWKHLLYKDWLFFSVSPEVSFPRYQDFKDQWSIFFELEVFFSKQPSLKKIHATNKY